MKFFFTLLFAALFRFALPAQQLVMPGANPDPSVVKIGNTYWSSATSSDWFPAFPLSYSKDLIHWTQKGYVFTKMPDWADSYFWAPEITYDSGRVYVYYTAHKKNANLCVGVASAERPEGPYTDHGPLVCENLGSIDPFPMRDTCGNLYLIWKEDANSAGLPTPIWAQQMNNERTALIGEKKELFRNNAPWEKELVEGVSIIRHGEFYYAIYAAAGCCGLRCSYESGVARARDLLGPWEKYNKNPILKDAGNWICKGHGTPIEKDGRFYFLYHGYDRITSAFTGREALLQEFRFTPDNWIEFINTSKDSILRKELIIDEFKEKTLPEKWQWSVFHNVKYELKNEQLNLFALPSASGSFIGQRIVSADYTATTTVDVKKSTAFSGLAAIGDEDNIVALLAKADQLQVFKVENGNDTILSTFTINPKQKIFLQMRVRGPYRISFYYSYNGKDFVLLNRTPIRGAYLPPWDSPPRAGLIAKGATSEKAVFDRFQIVAGILNPPDESNMDKVFKVLLYLLPAAFFIWLFIHFYKGKYRRI